jgi:Putative  PD-(D/E)XK family member, (DUF4420)
MTTDDRSGRPISPELLNQYFNLPFRSRLVIWDDPWVEVGIDPLSETISLRTDAGETPLGKINYLQVSIARLEAGRGPIDEVQIMSGKADWASFAFLVSIAHAIIGGAEFEDAVHDAFDSYEELLGKGAEATIELVVGLFGELIVLDELIKFVPPDVAIDSWRGPDGGEHDFSLSEITLEVKTTLSESRKHRISSLRQLEPVNQLPLELVSIRLTEAPGAGLSLHELIASVRLDVGDSRAALDEKIALHSFLKLPSAALDRKFAQRDEPRSFLAGSDFHPLTREVLATALGDSQQVTSVSYVLDLEGIIGARLVDRFVQRSTGGPDIG